ncbi:MAG: NADH-quinone oxidoreductase subunit L [Propionibacteriaceae bacterium]|jgi:NADH-quinone oxidoreductase subunit L|nr:NADH-quinone oxidoreductase subunit L [Propionibacteriaceae bacterium]
MILLEPELTGQTLYISGGVFDFAWLMLAAPAVGAAVLLLTGSFFDKRGHWISILAVLASFATALAIFVQFLIGGGGSYSVDYLNWITTPAWSVNIGLYIDQLSILFALLITGVGSVIHIYSVGYMAHDVRRRRFFAFLNLFVFAMLLLVLANDYLVLFVGWEGVGLSSYLLIGFWQHKPAAAAAAKKAFVMNRIGDLGLTMTVFTLLAFLGSSSFADVDAKIGTLSPQWITAVGLFLLLAACGKSAQFPLQAWLLDAMEGPTPVSALIHAATMVTAGVYLVVRSHTIFAVSEIATTAVVIVATVTIFIGAWIGCAKDDIKKVLAGSTMSQIGYMLLAAGIGPAGYAFAIFHLITHGFFKANMFLGAGSVMHATGDDVDMRHFGGLARFLPVTFATFAMGYLAIIGIPPLAGYFSKDHIIEAAFEHNLVVGSAALLGAGITAFYMTRLMMMTFFGARRWEPGVHPHESPKSMTIQLIILALFSVAIGVVMNGWIQGWLAPALGTEVHEIQWLPTPIGLITLLVVIVGVAAGVYLFRVRPVPVAQPQTKNPLVIAGRNDLFGDLANETLVVKPTMFAAQVANANDTVFIDGAIDGVAVGALKLSEIGRKLQSGRVRSYALATFVGAVFIGVITIIGQLG